MDSHDMPRFLSMVSGKKEAFRLASLFQMTYPGAPCIYYGNEIGMMGAIFSYKTSPIGCYWLS
jgi:neopullulanase